MTLRIVHIIHCCSSGGAEVLAKNIIKNIKKINSEIEVELWSIYKANVLFDGDKRAIEFEQNFVKELNDVGVNVRFIDKQKDILSKIKLMTKINKNYNRFKPDLIHCHLESVTFHTVNSLLFRNVRIIETIHNTKLNHPKLHKYYLNYRLKKIVSISEKVSKVIKHDLKVKDDKVKLIYNGIEMDKFQDVNIYKKDVNTMLAVGRLTNQKDHMTLLKAFKKMKEMCIYNNIQIPKLNIIGDGELKKELLDYVKRENLIEVNFLGVVKDVENYLKSSQIYIMSSIYEGLSLSLIEASVSGISVICTDVGSNDEIIKDRINGIIVESKDYEMMAKSMFKLIQDKELRIKLRKNYKESIAKFGIVECAKSHIDLYKTIMK